MTTLHLQAMLSGLLFGIWPLLINRSGLRGTFSAFVISATLCACAAPIVLADVRGFADAKWSIAIAGALIAAAGMLAFNSMLAKADQQSVSALFVLMIVVQSAVPAAYQAFQAGGITLTRGIGFALAIAAAALLTI